MQKQVGEKHLHLFPGRVLSFIQNDKAVIQGTAPHIGQGGDFNRPSLLVLLEGLCPQHVVERVIQGPQIGVYLILQVPRQKAEPFPCLYRRPGEDDSVHRPFPKSGYGGCHRQIGLAGTGRAYANGDCILGNGLHIGLLAHGFGLDGLSLGGDAHHVLGHLLHLGIVSFVDQGDEIAHPLFIDCLPLGSQRQQPFQRAHGFIHHFFIAGHLQIRAPVDNAHIQRIFNTPDIFIEGTEHGNDILQPLCIHNPLYHLLINSNHLNNLI